jgi:deazaflavin-dependent oxidoreductase (nitroreductase family)
MNTSENQSKQSHAKSKGFWFMNALINPLMGVILRSPLNPMMSGTVALITVRGRKSGKAYTLPVQYAQEGQAIYIVPGMPENKTWWRNLRGGAAVTLLLRGRQEQAQAELLSGSAVVDALKVFHRRFPASARVAHVSMAPDGSFNAAELAAVADHTIVVRVMMP